MHLFKFKDNNEFIKLFKLEDVRLIRYAQVDLELNIINKAEYEEIKQKIFKTAIDRHPTVINKFTI